jgi:hypothetical protein
MHRAVALVCAAALALSSTGCLVTRGGQLPELPKTPAVAAPAVAASYAFHWETNGNPNPKGGARIEPVISPTLVGTHAFTQVVQGQGGQVQLDITVNDKGNMPLAVLSGVITGLSLYVIPGYARDDYEMNVVVSKNCEELKRYRYTENVTIVMELLLVFGMPFVEGNDAPKNAIKDMTKHLVADMAKDGLLSG